MDRLFSGHDSPVFLDEHEKSPEHLKQAETAYVELSELYNWDTIECVDNGRIKTPEEVSEEVMKIVFKD